ncbi:MAG TPA: hypothetical protein VFS44_08825 [Gemmatimonadaceae bacterium]|nr:hypothetical protein [Gemmatimonadaceae bacterium]
MPLPREILAELASKRAAERAAAERDRRRDLARTALECFGWAAAGILAILWSVHTTDPTAGRVAFYGGMGLGNGGILLSLLAAYRRGERRGDR